MPPELTSFVGRERELEEIGSLLTKGRLLTLAGPGGCGKTRLAVRAAAGLAASFAGGVFFVGLASLSDKTLIPQAAARAVGVREGLGLPPLEALVEHLGEERESLLVLDNCEHLIEGCAWLAVTLLGSCPRLRVLATSREVLKVPGEAVFSVPALSSPDHRDAPSREVLLGYEATRLFAERAEAASGVALGAEETYAVAQICRALDGMPLAIELAAARARVLSAGQILRRLSDRFRLLTSGGRTALPRQRTLRATMDWSHDLLPEEERTLFRRLSVFAGGFTLEAAEAVCSGGEVKEEDVLNLLERLVEKSLVLASRSGAEARYRMLETVRQYGMEKLEESEEARVVRERQAGFFLGMAEAAEPALAGPEQEAWLDRLEAEHDNLRSALGWLEKEGEIEQALGLAGALGRFWYLRGYHTEGRARLEGLLTMPDAQASTVARAWALGNLGAMIHRLADRTEGDQEVALSHLRESAEIYRELDDAPRTAAALRGLGNVALGAGEWETAQSALEESLEIERRLGNDRGVTLTRVELGILALLRGDPGSARAHLEESLTVLREWGSRQDVNICLYFLGHLACDRGDHPEARALFAEMMTGSDILKYRYAVPFMVEAHAYLAAGEGKAARALRLEGAAKALGEAIGGSGGAAFEAYVRRGLESAWRALGEEEGATVFEQGRAMTLEDAVAYALEATPRVQVSPTARPNENPLSPRESEVLGLVAEGLTDAQVAERLYLSPRTVGGHLRSIYRKLEVSTRTAALSRAKDLDLL